MKTTAGLNALDHGTKPPFPANTLLTVPFAVPVPSFVCSQQMRPPSTPPNSPSPPAPPDAPPLPPLSPVRCRHPNPLPFTLHVLVVVVADSCLVACVFAAPATASRGTCDGLRGRGVGAVFVDANLPRNFLCTRRDVSSAYKLDRARWRRRRQPWRLRLRVFGGMFFCQPLTLVLRQSGSKLTFACVCVCLILILSATPTAHLPKKHRLSALCCHWEYGDAVDEQPRVQ